MKLLISLLMIPVHIALGLNLLITGFVWLVLSNPQWIADGTAAAHTLKGCVYAAVGCGLPLAVLIALASIVLTTASFIAKSWSFALFSGAGAAVAISIWLYFLNLNYPL